MSSPDDPDLRDLPEDDDAFDPGPVPGPDDEPSPAERARARAFGELLDKVVDGWRVVLKIGQGATGTVYEARRKGARAAAWRCVRICPTGVRSRASG